MKTIKGIDRTLKIDQNDCFWVMLCRLEEKQTALNEDDIQNKKGVYIFWDWEDHPIRIGIASKLRNRIISYDTNPQNWYVYEHMYPHIAFVSVIYTDSQIESQTLEKELIYAHQPKFNYRHLNCY